MSNKGTLHQQYIFGNMPILVAYVHKSWKTECFIQDWRKRFLIYLYFPSIILVGNVNWIQKDGIAWCLFLDSTYRGIGFNNGIYLCITQNQCNKMNSESSSNNKRIAKNTLLLYFRMLLTMVVSLYTSRVVLGALGVGLLDSIPSVLILSPA